MIRKALRILGNFIPVLLLLAYAVIVVCFLNRWDSVVPFTLIPFWIWMLAGALISLVFWLMFRIKNIMIVFFVWVISGVAFSYETRGMGREMAYALSSKKAATLSDRDSDVIRILSVNCDDGNIDAARVAIPYNPDIVFFQKAPLLSELTELATKIYGVDAAVLRSQTSAIIARGEFLNSVSSTEQQANHVRLRLPSEQLIDLTNLELPRSLPTFRLWDTRAWQPLIEKRKENRKRIRNALVNYNPTAELPPRIIGGDFGTQPGDDIFRPLERAGLTDSYFSAGSDWGNTYLAKTPFFRHTQFWISGEIEPVRVRSIRTKHSRQKMVLLDFRIKPTE